MGIIWYNKVSPKQDIIAQKFKILKFFQSKKTRMASRDSRIYQVKMIGMPPRLGQYALKSEIDELCSKRGEIIDPKVKVALCEFISFQDRENTDG